MGKWFQDKSFSTEKREQGIKARKGHRDTNTRKMQHRALGILLAAALVFQTVPFGGTAVSASEGGGGGLCAHHTEHTPDCGYKEAESGHDCTHAHTEDCYQIVEGEDGSTTKELDCHHAHDESCGYREAAEESPCTFVCEVCNGGTGETPGDKTDGNGIDDGDSENPGAGSGNEVKEPGDGQEECICEKLCTEDSINTDCPVCGAETASLSDCKGKDTEDSTEENTDQPEDTGLCKHHREHDDICGYLPASEDSEGSPCTYACRICPIEELIAALPDAADITEDNADEVRAQLEEILALYRELNEDEQEQIDLSRCYALQEALDKANAPVTTEEIPADAVAKIEKEDTGTVYVTAGDLDDVFAENSSYAGATFTLLDNVERLSDLYININCTLNLNGHTIHLTGDYACVSIFESTVIIQGEGGIISETGSALSVEGNVTLEGGTFTSNDGQYASIYVNKVDATLFVTGENVVIQNTKGYGLGIGMAQSVQLSAGKYSGAKGAIAISGSLTLGDLLGHTDNTRYAYFDSTGTTPFTGKLDETVLNGTVRVKKCEHTGDDIWQCTQDADELTHTRTCLACGKTKTEDCEFSETAVPTADGHTGQCPFCKRNQSGAHRFSDWTGNPVAKTCTVCGYEQVAVAKVEKNRSTTYVDAAHFANAIAPISGNDATFTMLQDVTLTGWVNISCSNLILDLNGHSITVEEYFHTQSSSTVTIKDSKGSGAIISQTDNALFTETATGLTIEGGTFRGAGGNAALYIQYRPIVLAGGTFEGIECVQTTLKELLRPGCCYYDQNNKPIVLTNGQTKLTGTVTVGVCTHDYKYTHTNGTTTHSQICPACGDAKISESCNYVDGKCACGSTLSVALTGTEQLVYDGNPHEPGVAVTLDGTKLTTADYDVTYANNIKAGTDTATVTVKGKGSYKFEIEKTFSIEKAEQKDFAVVEETMQYKKNGTFTLSTTGGGGDGAVLYRVPENNGVLMVNGSTAVMIGVGTVTVTAAKAESNNYKAATATATGKITIEKAPAPAITYPTAAGSITYGQELSDCALTGGSTEYGTFAWENGSMIPTVDNTGYTVVFTASKETEKNYAAITDTIQKVSLNVKKAVPAVSVTAAVSGSKDNRQAVLTVNVAKAGAGAFPTGTVTFIDCTGSTEREIGTATLNNGSAFFTWDGLLDQTYTIKAVYAGNGNYKEAESRAFTFDAAKQNQQDFALDAIGAKTYGDTAISLKTTGGSGSGAVRYESSDEDVIRIEDGRAVIVGAGTATITAIKEGDDKYNEASASRNVTVAKKALTVSADSRTVVRGNPMPAFTYRADGLVNGDTFTTAPSITAGAQDTDTLGKYDIVINGGTLRNSGSYRITYVNGTLNIVELIYTVTVTDGTGGGEYAEGDTVTVTARERNGYTFTGWSSKDGVAFADSKAKTTTFPMPAKSVTVKANYTRNSSSGSNGGGSGDGGNSGGSGNNGGNSGDNGNNGGGGSTNPGNGDSTPQIPVTPPAQSTNPGSEATPGTGTTPVNPGNRNTVRPGTGSGSSAGTSAQGTKQPFIKGEDGKIGWDVIRTEEEKAQEGSTINVDMNGSVVVPGDIFDSIKGRDITITFDMGSGILWSVDGKSITTDKAGDIDFSVKMGVNTVPVDIVNNVTGESYSIQLSLAYEGELAFICADEVAEDGAVSLAFTHASDYVIVIDGDGEEESSTIEAPKTDNGNTSTGVEDIGVKDDMRNRIWIIAAGIVIIVLSLGIYFIVKRKKR